MDITKLSDEELIVHIREKDHEAYYFVIERYQVKLSHYLRKFIKDPDELEDVLQDVFIKTYKNLYGFNVDKKFSSWIYRIAHNEAINFIKKNKGNLNLDDVEYKLIGERLVMEEKIDLNLEREEIKEALSKIKLKYKDALLLFYFEDRSYEDISDIMRIPKNTVGTYISRGKKDLKQILLKMYERKR